MIHSHARFWIAAEAKVARAARDHIVNVRRHPVQWLRASGYRIDGRADAYERWMRTPLVPAHLHPVNRRPFLPIPRHLVRRAVLVLMLIAVTSGLVFNAVTLLLPKLLQERLAGNSTLLPLIGVTAFLVTLCGALTQFSVGRMIDRNTLKRVFLPVSIVLAPAMLALSFAQGWLVLPLAAAVAASVFGQVTVNDTMTARYISPELRAESTRCVSSSASWVPRPPPRWCPFYTSAPAAWLPSPRCWLSSPLRRWAARSSSRTARKNWSPSCGRKHSPSR